MKMKCCESIPKSCIHNTSFQSQLMNAPNQLECLSLEKPFCLVQCNTLAYWAHSKFTMKMKCWESSPKSCIHSISIYSQLMNAPNQPERLSLEKPFCLVQCNTLAYQAHSKFMMKMKFCESSPRSLIHNTSFSLQLTHGPKKLEVCNWQAFPDQCTIQLIGPFISYKAL